MRLDGYIRVSRVGGREGASFVSPSVQREAIEKWATFKGVEIAEWHQDLDVSGGTLDRPAFQAALERIERGETEGLVVAKLDRFARSIPATYEAIQRIESGGGTFVSVADQFDLTTSAGRLMLNILSSFAQFERDRITENWQNAMGRAIDRGVHFTNSPPFGYWRGDDGRLVPDDEKAGLVREVFRRRAAGASWGELTAFLNSHTKTSTGASWQGRTVAQLIPRRAYLGEAYHGEYHNANAHPAIVSEQEWHAANALRGPAAPVREGSALLSGLVRCAGCRYAMKADQAKMRDGDRVAQYRCSGQHGTGKCPAPASMMAHVLEPSVEARFLWWAGDATVSLEGGRDEEVEAFRERVRKAEADLATWRDDDELRAMIGDEQYRAGFPARMEAVDRAKAAFKRSKSAQA